MRRSTAQFSAQVRRFLSAREAATAIEYALIAGGISVAIITSVTALGTNMMTVFYDKLLNMF
jgi:pilus assembly protein Flp/PilA